MQDIMLPSFAAQYGYKIKLCATDVVLACAAVLEGVVSVCVCVCVCACMFVNVFMRVSVIVCGCDSVYV